jgi:hypothetical protein
MKYKMDLQLFKLFNGYEPILDWLSLNQHLVLTSRQHFFEITSHTNYKIGNNFLSDRFHCLNKQIPLTWLSQSFNSFKLKCKTHNCRCKLTQYESYFQLLSFTTILYDFPKCAFKKVRGLSINNL